MSSIILSEFELEKVFITQSFSKQTNRLKSICGGKCLVLPQNIYKFNSRLIKDLKEKKINKKQSNSTKPSWM